MEENKIIRVIITEDHQIVRQGLRLLLHEDSGIKVVGEAANGVELLELLKDVPADVVLIDVNMPIMDGYEVTARVVKEFPEVKVIILSMLHNLPVVQKLLQLGASGYMLKNSNKDELRSAIKLVAGGNKYISSELSVSLLEDSYSTTVAGNAEYPLNLSKREIEVLLLIAEGYTNAEIADKLFNSKRTIETHRQNMLAKTGAKNTANLIKYAIEHKILR